MIASMIELADDGADPSLRVRNCHFTPRRCGEEACAVKQRQLPILFIVNDFAKANGDSRPAQCANETHRRSKVVAHETRALYCSKMRAPLENIAIAAAVTPCSAKPRGWRP